MSLHSYHNGRRLPSLTTFLFLLVVLTVSQFLCTVTVVHGEEGAAPPGDDSSNDSASGGVELPPIPDDDTTLLKMKVRELKGFLDRKGADAACMACTSKREYVDRIRETMTWPDVTPEPEPEKAMSDDDTPSMEELQKMFQKKEDTPEMIKLKEQLKAAGIDASVLSKGDFGNNFKNVYDADNAKGNGDAATDDKGDEAASGDDSGGDDQEDL